MAVLDGRATWKQLQPHCTQHAVRRALDAGLLIRARRGLYVLADLPDARAAAARVNGVLSHVSAAVDLGLAVLGRPIEIHVTVPRGATRRSPANTVLHHLDLPRDDVRGVTTSPLRTVLDCAAGSPFPEALAVADSALREGYVRREDLLDAARDTRGPRRRAVLRVAAEANGDAANSFESALRAAVLDAGVTGFEPQQAVALKGVVGGNLAVHVDLGDPRRRIALEADSFAHHGTRGALRDDCRRYDELVRAGWRVLRFAWEHVVLEPGWVGAVVRDTCDLDRAA
ncbi:MAG: hypothetical protein ACXV3S_01635 [Kineosporiaceae bacterium]